MRKFKSLLDHAMQHTQLVKVRLKVDPANCKGGEIQKYNGYEGYVLAERGGKTRIMIAENCCDIIDVPNEMIDVVVPTTPLDLLKVIAFEHLALPSNDPLAVMIIASNTPEALETFMREHGVDAEKLLGIYRTAYFSR
jgi:hypothetical protein